MFKLEKKQVKLISIIVAVLFVLGIVAIAATQIGAGKSYAASSTNNSSVGVIDNNILFRDLPEVKQVSEQLKIELENIKKEFIEKSKNINDQQKQDLYHQLQQSFMTKEQELKKPIFDKINDAIKVIAKAKGINVVIDKSSVIYGGQDITDEVLKKLISK